MELARRRKAVELLNPKLADGASEEVETILDREIELRIFRPENQINKAGIMYFHGGGFVMCHVKMYRKFLTNLGKCYILSSIQSHYSYHFSESYGFSCILCQLSKSARTSISSRSTRRFRFNPLFISKCIQVWFRSK